MRNTRATIAGIVGGIVILAVLIGYAVGLPKAVGDADTQSTPTLPTLPDRLDDHFLAMSAVTPDDFSFTAQQNQVVAQGLAAQAKKQDDAATKQLTGLYGGAEVRFYADPTALLNALRTGGSAPTVAVTVVPGETGLVLPSGPFTGSEAQGQYQLKKVDGHQCATVIQGAQPATPYSPATPTTSKLSECRDTAGGLAYDVFGSGVPLDKVAGYLDDVLAGSAAE